MEDESNSRDPLENATVVDDDEPIITEKSGIDPEHNGDQDTIKEEGTPQVGMSFGSFEEVYDFYNEYARRVGFGTKIRRSFYTVEDGQCNKFTLTCCKEGKKVYKNSERSSSYCLRLSARTDCQAKIKVQKCVDGLLHLVEVTLEHNHPVNPSLARFFRSHKGSNDKLKKLPIMRAKGIYVPGESEQEIPSGKGQSLFNLCADDFQTLQQFFIRMQSSNTNFYHVMDLDEVGRLKNVFWADGRSKAAYQCFGDVITFDTTYLMNDYNTPLSLFVGVNNHGQLVLFGCALLSSRSSEAYKWLFRVWMSCMSGVPPNAIITDHCKSIQEAVAEVFPDTRHRVCQWHVMKRIQENLGGYAEYKMIKKTMKKAVYESVRVDEFELQWRFMVEKYGLEDNEWLEFLYGDRCLWVPAFLKETFWAGMPIMQHKESLNSYFDGHIHPKSSLKQFICKYESALQSKYVKEAQADYDSFHKTPQLISKFYMEDQLRKIYTVDIFKKFQEEVRAILYCIPSLLRVDGPISTIEVKEPANMKDCNQIENRDYEVTYNSNERDVQCNCGFFQFQGLLCRHALSVLNFLEVYEIPSRYILERWRKDFKQRSALNCSSNDLVANGPMKRYDNLYKCCLKFAEVGAISDESYEFALKMINEVTEELIANDSTISDMLPRICRTMNNDNDDIHSLVQIKRKGQPHKKQKESLVEKIVKTSKKKVSHKKPIDVGQSDVPHIVPNTPQFNAHIWTQESINLAEHVSPTNLSIGNHFGLQLNHQHAINNQQGMHWNFQQIFQQTHTPEAPPGPWAG